MAEDNIHSPANFKGVMVSSTFTDLKQHRAELMKALEMEELFAIGMEKYVPVPGDDVISSSLNMVGKGSAYVGLISHRCGQVPECAERNPQEYSITRLEFEEAQRLGSPTLVFIMGDDHAVKRQDVETDAEKIQKLEAYRKRAKEGRIYVEFESLEEFTQKAIHAVASLRRYLEEQDRSAAPQPQEPSPTPPPDKAKPDTIPAPPAFYAEPPYIGSHEFVGRKAQLDTLNDWAAPADSHSVLLFEAIGGAGKSLLTWEWVTKHVKGIRQDWAGVFWYSFYERGAIMADFCWRALAYMTGKPLADFRKKKTPELADMLLHQLQARPWLIVFDGLERVLVAYHRFDAAQITDEEAGAAVDQIAHRDPCAAIRPEDDDLLRALAGAAPSKLLLTSRLIPRVLLNAANQPIPGVLRERLPGLRPPDAEALFRACGVNGDSKDIQNYLKTHCDCHPLVIGALAGLINDYLPNRGNFDAWAADPAGGGKLNLADLDLVQKRNHILHAALAALPEKSGQLLSTLALLSEAIDYRTLSALSPYEEAENVEELAKTVRDLESRGLLQYERQTKRYDLHPVVRGIAAGELRQEQKERYGQCVVDHFSRQAHSPWEEAETLEDLRDGLHIVRTLLQMGHHQQACDAYMGDLANALLINLEAYAEILSLLRPFFPQGWSTLPNGLDAWDAASLANDAANALSDTGEPEVALAAYGVSLLVDLKQEVWTAVQVDLSNISSVLADENRLAKEERCLLLALDLAQLGDEEDLFCARLNRFWQLANIGRWTNAEAMWRLLDPMGRDWSRNLYQPGTAEHYYAWFRFYQGDMTEDYLTHAEQLAKAGKTRMDIRHLHGLRGQWRLEQGDYALAADSLHEAVRMAREVSVIDADTMKAEAQLVIAKFHLGELADPRDEAEQLTRAKKPFHRGLADLWLAIGDREQAKKHALDAYKWAWADGEPYVRRYKLNKARALLDQLGADIPDLPPYDPAKDEKFPWEDAVAAAIDKLRAEKEAKESAEESEEE